MFIGVLPTCMSVWGCQNPWSWSSQVWSAMWVLGIEPGSSRRTASALRITFVCLLRGGCHDVFVWIRRQLGDSHFAPPTMWVLENQTQTQLQVFRLGSKFSYLPFGFSHADKIWDSEWGLKRKSEVECIEFKSYCKVTITVWHYY